MNVAELLKSEMLIFSFIRGSHMYGTNIETSDEDLGGVYVIPNSEWLSLFHPQSEVKDDKQDKAFLEFRKFMNLACTANPTVLETMFVPEDCRRIWTILNQNSQLSSGNLLR